VYLASVPDSFLMVLAVRSADLDKPFVKDRRDAFHSAACRKTLDERF